jgi:hypothetical protein
MNSTRGETVKIQTKKAKACLAKKRSETDLDNLKQVKNFFLLVFKEQSSKGALPLYPTKK